MAISDRLIERRTGRRPVRHSTSGNRSAGLLARHYIIGPFAAAVALGLLGTDAITQYGKNESPIEAIGTERSPVVDYTCGSLGQGLSAAVGFALSDQLRNHDAFTYAMISDGELEEGQIWEAALFAAHHRLGSLIVTLDANNSQVDGPVDSITTLEPIAAKWQAFGWHAIDLDGHDVHAIMTALAEAKTDTARPSILICRTSTLHGLTCLPESADGHFIKLPPALADTAVVELESRLKEQRA